MRSGFPFLRALLGATLLCAALGGCNFGRNVADDCWIDGTNLQYAENFLTGLRQRNVGVGEPARTTSGERLTRSRKALQACQDDVPGLGRPPLGAAPSEHASAGGAHGA